MRAFEMYGRNNCRRGIYIACRHNDALERIRRQKTYRIEPQVQCGNSVDTAL